MFDQLGALAPQSPWAPILVAGGIVGIGVILTLSIRSKIAKRNAARPSSRAVIEQIKRAAGVDTRRGDDRTNALAAELLETVQNLASRLDNKGRRLEALIDEADRRLDALAKAEQGGGTSRAANPVPTIPSRAPAGEPKSLGNGAPAPAITSRQVDPLTRQVYQHADDGLNVVEIARRLDEQVGKVELILALRDP